MGVGGLVGTEVEEKEEREEEKFKSSQARPEFPQSLALSPLLTFTSPIYSST